MNPANSPEINEDNNDDLFKDMSDDQVEEKNEEVLDLIEHVHSRIDYTEQRRFGYLQIGLALLAVSGGGGAIVVTLLDKPTTTLITNLVLYFLGFASALLCIVGLLIVLCYNYQTNPKYPFIDVTKTWKWFYHYMDIEALRTKISYSPQERQAYNEEYIGKLEGYTESLIKETIKEKLKQNISQLYLYLVLEKYKNDFTRQLQAILCYGIICSLIIALIIALFVCFKESVANFFNGGVIFSC